MKYAEAREELRRILNEQQTVSVPKLKRIITSMNIPLRRDAEPNAEVTYLKGRVSKLDKELVLKQKENAAIRRTVVSLKRVVVKLGGELDGSDSTEEEISNKEGN
jgi:predicted RNase H-like nuclease (RuvC/YqgF family)